MLIVPSIEAWPFSSYRKRDFACVCPRCLKLWASIGLGKKGFDIWGNECSDCAYKGEFDWWKPWWKIEGSLLDILEHWNKDSFGASQIGAIEAILNEFTPAMLDHELTVHLKAWDYFSKSEEIENAS